MTKHSYAIDISWLSIPAVGVLEMLNPRHRLSSPNCNQLVSFFTLSFLCSFSGSVLLTVGRHLAATGSSLSSWEDMALARRGDSTKLFALSTVRLDTGRAWNMQGKMTIYVHQRKTKGPKKPDSDECALIR